MNPWAAEFLEAALICHDENPELGGKTIFDFSRGAVRGVERIAHNLRHLEDLTGTSAYVSLAGLGDGDERLLGLHMHNSNPTVGDDGKIYFE